MSIIIPTYNRCELLEITLNSLLKSDIDLDTIEVIVVDDGSDDNTSEMVKKYSTACDLKYFYQEDLGRRVSLARNIGIDNASGEICVFIDSGIIVSVGFLAEHLKLHRHSSHAVAVIGYVYGFENHNEKGEDLKNLLSLDFPDRSIEYFKESSTFLDYREVFYCNYLSDLSDLPAPWVFFWTCNISVRREELIKVGCFDTNFDLNWGMEDVDLGYRLFKSDVKFVLGRDTSCIHYPHEKDLVDNFKQQRINKKYFASKYKTKEAQMLYEEENDLNGFLQKITAINAKKLYSQKIQLEES